MSRWKRRSAGVAFGLAIFVAGNVAAEVSQQRVNAMARAARRFDALSSRLPEQGRRLLSSDTLNFANLTRRFKDIGAAIRIPLRGGETRGGSAMPPNLIAAPQNISRPAFDTLFSSFAGFVQSETSTAWCGSNLVTGFNDSGSVFEGLVFSPSGSLSFDGYAVSTDTGTSFADQGALLPDPIPAGITHRDLEGDPVVACTDKTNFFFSSLALDTDSGDNQFSGVTVSHSTNGGTSFGGAVMAVSKDANTHLLDKDWMTVDPTNSSRLYVTYTDFDFSAVCGLDAGNNPIPRIAIEIVSSTDAGANWSSPVVVREVCFDPNSLFGPAVTGSQAVVGPAGEVYVAFESYDSSGAAQLQISKSTDNGQNFDPPVKVDEVTPVGSELLSALQGGFRVSEWPSLAVDRSGTASQGFLYIAWNDGRNLSVPDAVSDTYHYADILVSRSSDGGNTWSNPVRVNDNVEPLPSGLGTDQFQPGVAVDQTSARLGVCFYDRRRDSRNFRIDRECATSTDRGKTWTNTRITAAPFAGTIGQDLLVVPNYMGDYDTVASDFRRANPGFFGAWGDNSRGNPDVKGAKF